MVPRNINIINNNKVTTKGIMFNTMTTIRTINTMTTDTTIT